MDIVEASNAINARFISLWPERSGGVLYATDNTVRKEEGYFARLAIVTSDTEQASFGRIGHQRWTTEGVIEVRLSGPVGEGRKRLDELAKVVRGIFQAKRFGRTARDQGIVAREMSVSELRRDREAPHRWILTCSTSFEYTERG